MLSADGRERVYPDPVPTNSSPFAGKVDIPVPPYCTPITDPCQVPDVIVDTEVIG